MQSDQCVLCKHYLGILTCEAFTERIPEAILLGDHDHRQPYEGDNGIQFESIDEDELRKGTG